MDIKKKLERELNILVKIKKRIRTLTKKKIELNILVKINYANSLSSIHVC
jgi:hypothetical protein